MMNWLDEFDPWDLSNAIGLPQYAKEVIQITTTIFLLFLFPYLRIHSEMKIPPDYTNSIYKVSANTYNNGSGKEVWC